MNDILVSLLVLTGSFVPIFLWQWEKSHREKDLQKIIARVQRDAVWHQQPAKAELFPLDCKRNIKI